MRRRVDKNGGHLLNDGTIDESIEDAEFFTEKLSRSIKRIPWKKYEHYARKSKRIFFPYLTDWVPGVLCTLRKLSLSCLLNLVTFKKPHLQRNANPSRYQLTSWHDWNISWRIGSEQTCATAMLLRTIASM